MKAECEGDLFLVTGVESDPKNQFTFLREYGEVMTRVHNTTTKTLEIIIDVLKGKHDE